MPDGAEDTACAVVGAGIAGLVAATALTERDVPTVVLETAPGPGGRLETRIEPDPLIGAAVWDVGAQFLTCRDAEFRPFVEEWLEAGILTEWFRGLPPPDPPPGDDEPHYRGVDGMEAIGAHLARGLDVRTSWTAQRIEAVDGRWTVTSSGRSEATVDAGGVVPDPPGRRRVTADALILATPVPVAIRLLDAGGVALPHRLRAAIDRVRYEPTLALLARAEGPTTLPAPGAWHGDGEPLDWVADNLMKGISDVPTVTVHAGGGFSRRHLDEPDDAWVEGLLGAAAEIAGRALTVMYVHRWPHATPRPTHPERTVATTVARAPLAFAGDAFAGPRVEGAALSGLAAADAVVDRGR